MWRWTEVDPFGHTIYCSEETWKRKTVQRSDLAAHEVEVRATVRDPDAIYDDSQSTASTREEGNPTALVVRHVGFGRTHGRYAGKVLNVVIKWLPDAATGRVTGFVSTAFPSPRVARWLELRWERGHERTVDRRS